MPNNNSLTFEKRKHPLVLVVDDDDLIRRSLKQNLTRLGCHVLLASDGSQALEIAIQARPSVIFLDLQMPKVDGYGLLRRLPENDVRASVVVMSGRNEIDDVIAALRSGAVDYLKKPWNSGDLAAALERAMAISDTFSDSRKDDWSVLDLAPAARTPQAAELSDVATVTDLTATRAIGENAELEFRFALGVQKMWIAMQPVVSWRTRSVFAYEALLRTDEPALRNPLDFLDAASRLNRTAELGRLIRTRIAEDIAHAPAQAKIFVNLLPSELIDEGLADGSDPLTSLAERIVLEVTERAALDKMPGLAAAIARLRQRGYRIGLDDLGAGYAGLCSFALLEPEIVKVDMSLIRDIHLSSIKQKLFGSFTALCRDLSVEVVAEGVEVAEERSCLNTLGGDLYQGYLFARPDRGFPVPTF